MNHNTMHTTTMTMAATGTTGTRTAGGTTFLIHHTPLRGHGHGSVTSYIARPRRV
ncbi:hypothetical protein CGZ88_0728 [Bifidobacterium anseris]|uniref:Uncharacterized protein n=1 Tax=Bifidobacterium anseris TaxID=2020963 RepID=A0A2N5J301_9BIFI|nr:hypothetical protein [Bifidobacterium anseris]PLS28566.1 hypothetical protein CGZ88_0728 [Bifidobacterium anseris]